MRLFGHYVVSDSFATSWTVNCQAPLSGISQSRTLGWVTTPFSRGSSWPEDQSHVSCIDKQILHCWATREALNKCHLLLLLWPYYDQISLGKLISRVKCPKEHDLGLLYPSQQTLLRRDRLSHPDLTIRFGKKLLTQVESVQENDETW